jgi:hypothetical protein
MTHIYIKQTGENKGGKVFVHVGKEVHEFNSWADFMVNGFHLWEKAKEKEDDNPQ